NSDFTKSCQAPDAKIFCFTILEIRIISFVIPAHPRGVSRSSRCVGLGSGGRFGVRRFLTPDENAKAYGEVVWSWRRDAGAKPCGKFFRRVTVANKPAHRGEHEVSRKAIARGRPGCFG